MAGRVFGLGGCGARMEENEDSKNLAERSPCLGSTDGEAKIQKEKKLVKSIPQQS